MCGKRLEDKEEKSGRQRHAKRKRKREQES